MVGEIGGPANDPNMGAEEEAAMIRAIAEALARRFELDLADGKLMDRPILCLLFMCENLLNRVELIEEILEIKQLKNPDPPGSIIQ